MQKEKLGKSQWQMLPTIVALAWPTMLEQLMHSAVQYIDTAMVGVLGTQATAAVGSTSTVNWMISSSLTALGIGFLSYIAKARGAREDKLAVRAVGQSVFAVLVCGILFTILTLSLSSKVPVWMRVDPQIRSLASTYFFILYTPMLPRTASIIFGTVLRAAGDTKSPMRVGALVNLTNVILNFLLIYPTRQITFLGISMQMIGADLGVIGAAIASSIAFAIGGICITIVLWRHKEISPRGQRILPDWSVLRPCLRVAIPNMFQKLGTSFGYVAFASMINSLGDISTAAHTIANTVESAFYIPGFGMQAAAATLSGNAYGARERKKMRDLGSMLLVLVVGLMIVTGGLLFVLAPTMMRIFASDPEVIRLGGIILRMVALSEPFFGVSIILEGMMQGVGNTKLPFVINLTGTWGVRILGTFICTQLLGLNLISAWGCMIAHNLLSCCLFSVYYVRQTWNPLLKES